MNGKFDSVSYFEFPEQMPYEQGTGVEDERHGLILASNSVEDGTLCFSVLRHPECLDTCRQMKIGRCFQFKLLSENKEIKKQNLAYIHPCSFKSRHDDCANATFSPSSIAVVSATDITEFTTFASIEDDGNITQWSAILFQIYKEMKLHLKCGKWMALLSSPVNQFLEMESVEQKELVKSCMEKTKVSLGSSSYITETLATLLSQYVS
eukprot:jgi/Picsp_1/6114/NSC_03468-R1_---NA---